MRLNRSPVVVSWLLPATLLLAGCAAGRGTHGSGFAANGKAPPAPPAADTQPARPAPVPEPAEAEVLSDITQLTRDFDRAGEGYFSPDMKWIIFQGVPHGEQQYQMYVAPLMDAAAPANAPADAPSPKQLGRPIRISPPNSRNTCGFFSPDGHDLIFASTAGKEKAEEPSAGFQRKGAVYRWAFPTGMEIYRVMEWRVAIPFPPGTTSLLPIPQSANLALPENRLTNNNAYDAEGAYSPDGKWICFTSFRTGDAEIWVMRIDGSDPVQITHAKGYDGGPFFSPDGKRLVYRSDRKGNDLLQLFVADLVFDDKGNITGSREEHQITSDENVNWGPYWYPDNQHIIFATSRHGHQNYELYTIRDDGSHAARVTYCDGFDGLPAFSPDGKWLMWSSKRTANNTTQLFLAKFHPPKDW